MFKLHWEHRTRCRLHRHASPKKIRYCLRSEEVCCAADNVWPTLLLHSTIPCPTELASHCAGSSRKKKFGIWKAALVQPHYSNTVTSLLLSESVTKYAQLRDPQCTPGSNCGSSRDSERISRSISSTF